MFAKLQERLAEQFDEMVEIRRYLHEHPELSFEEEKTPSYIAEYHRSLGHDVIEGVGGRGVTARMEGGSPGPVIALRADFDALPIKEETGLPFASKNEGKMHACGHDGHTAQLLVLARVLSEMKEDLHGTILFIHQHAEELAPGGAQAMIKDGCLEGVDAVYGTHLWATTPLGRMEYTRGPIMAAADKFSIQVKGKGGHGAQPHDTKDSILIGAQIIQSLQHIVSRNVDPMASAVVSVGHFESVNAYNVIADQAKIVGTARSFDESVRDLLAARIVETAERTAAVYGAEAEAKYERGYPAVVNHAEHAETAASVAARVSGVEEVVEAAPQMGGEDFAYFLQEKPGAFFFTGAMNPEWETAYPHHHPKFDIDERSMLHAAGILGGLALQAFGQHES
ncbi:M20 metallopeptidase family protein [Alkalicoccus urumqiensis]|uniref:Amidohydrolase n=1 Tax=Alkalicoccus urumqiensis TaxID=1548213 RepID=A0A2P6MFH3_ALKUR|nr:amidohydrolase [Alkalicoccus urumqiensis]PRO64990.1 amidohydrolase [Alkalicoccus urumqiensis]